MKNVETDAKENLGDLYKRYKKFVEKLYPGMPVDKTPDEFKEWWSQQSHEDQKKMENDFMAGHEQVIARSVERLKTTGRPPRQ